MVLVGGSKQVFRCQTYAVKMHDSYFDDVQSIALLGTRSVVVLNPRSTRQKEEKAIKICLTRVYSRRQVLFIFSLEPKFCKPITIIEACCQHHILTVILPESTSLLPQQSTDSKTHLPSPHTVCCLSETLHYTRRESLTKTLDKENSQHPLNKFKNVLSII